MNPTPRFCPSRVFLFEKKRETLSFTGEEE
jgi:hypothetical protein